MFKSHLTGSMEADCGQARESGFSLLSNVVPKSEKQVIQLPLVFFVLQARRLPVELSSTGFQKGFKFRSKVAMRTFFLV